MLAYSFWKVAVECARSGVIWDGHYLQFIPVDLLCDAMLANAQSVRPEFELVPTLEPLGTREIAPLLNCEVVPAGTFFHGNLQQTSRKLHDFADDTSYSDIENALSRSDLAQLIGEARIPDPFEVFAAGWSRRPIQRAIAAP